MLTRLQLLNFPKTQTNSQWFPWILIGVRFFRLLGEHVCNTLIRLGLISRVWGGQHRQEHMQTRMLETSSKKKIVFLYKMLSYRCDFVRTCFWLRFVICFGLGPAFAFGALYMFFWVSIGSEEHARGISYSARLDLSSVRSGSPLRDAANLKGFAHAGPL